MLQIMSIWCWLTFAALDVGVCDMRTSRVFSLRHGASGRCDIY